MTGNLAVPYMAAVWLACMATKSPYWDLAPGALNGADT